MDKNLSVTPAACHCPGCGSQRLLRCRSHPAGRGPNSSSLFPPLAAVVAVAHYICKWLNRFDKDRKPD